jgi:F-type H+-transporting ATPase subunit a
MLYHFAAFFQEHIEQRQENINTATTEAPTPPPELLFHVGPIAITNTLLTAWLVIIILVLFAWLSLRNMKSLPSGVQNFWEYVIELWVGVSTNTMGERRGRRFLPLVATAFLFILFSNWIGTLPISYITVVNEEGHQVPLFRSANSDLNNTAALAIFMIVIAEFFELRSLGGLGYLKGLIIPNPMRWMEIFTRPLSLSFRLFGNIFAGEVLLATMIAVAPFVLFVFIGLELFVGLIQALIFSMLSLVFLSIATVHEEAHEPHDAHESVESKIAAETHGQPF